MNSPALPNAARIPIRAKTIKIFMWQFSHRLSGRVSSSHLVFLVALIAAGVTARLGWWQLERAKLKEQQQALLQQQQSLPPIVASSLHPLPNAAPETLYQRTARLRGQWVPGSLMFLDNRPQDGRPGFIALSLLELSPGVAVLVQRGWAPRDRVDPTRLPVVSLPMETSVEVVGRISHPPSRLMELSDEGNGALRQNVDVRLLDREFSRSLPVLSVQQTEPTRICSLPKACEADLEDSLVRQWKLVASDPAKNRGYAVQWFSLSALIAGLWVWFQWVQPRRRRHAH